MMTQQIRREFLFFAENRLFRFALLSFEIRGINLIFIAPECAPQVVRNSASLEFHG